MRGVCWAAGPVWGPELPPEAQALLQQAEDWQGVEALALTTGLGSCQTLSQRSNASGRKRWRSSQLRAAYTLNAVTRTAVGSEAPATMSSRNTNMQDKKRGACTISRPLQGSIPLDAPLQGFIPPSLPSEGRSDSDSNHCTAEKKVPGHEEVAGAVTCIWPWSMQSATPAGETRPRTELSHLA